MSDFDDDVDFSRIRALFVRRWKTVAATVLVGTAASFVITGLRPRQFEAVVPLVLSGSPAAVGSSNAPSVRMLLTSPALLEEVVAGVEEGQDTRRIDPGDVFVDPVPQTSFVRLRVRQNDPDRAAHVAQVLAARGAELSRKLSAEPFEAVPNANGARLEAARAALDAAESRLLAFRRESQIEVLRRDIKIRLDQRATAQTLDWEIQRERARLAAALDELEGEPGDGKLASPERPGATSPGRSDALLEAFARAAAESRTRIAELEQARRQLAGSVKEEISPLQDLYRRELQLKRLEQEYELARRAYETEAVRARQGDAPTPVSVPMFKVVEDSAPEALLVPRERLRLVALAMLLSFLIGLALVILLELAEGPRQTDERASRA